MSDSPIPAEDVRDAPDRRRRRRAPADRRPRDRWRRVHRLAPRRPARRRAGRRRGRRRPVHGLARQPRRRQGGGAAQRRRAAHPHARRHVAGPRHADHVAPAASRRPPRPARARGHVGRRARPFVHVDARRPRRGRAASVEKVVVLLPATVLYGTPSARQLPVKEGEITPRGVRGVVAKAIVDLLTTYREEHGIEFTALAATTVYGPRQQPQRGAVARLLDAAANGEPARLTGDGRQTRDFVYVDDVVDALARTRQRGSGLVVNVGTGVQTSLRELVAMIGGGRPTVVRRRAAGRAGPLLRVAGAGPDPPRLGAVDDPAPTALARPAATPSVSARRRLTGGRASPAPAGRPPPASTSPTGRRRRACPPPRPHRRARRRPDRSRARRRSGRRAGRRRRRSARGRARAAGDRRGPSAPGHRRSARRRRPCRGAVPARRRRPGRARSGWIDTSGLDGAMTTIVGVVDRRQHGGASARAPRRLDADGGDLDVVVEADEVVLERAAPTPSARIEVGRHRRRRSSAGRARRRSTRRRSRR